MLIIWKRDMEFAFDSGGNDNVILNSLSSYDDKKSEISLFYQPFCTNKIISSVATAVCIPKEILLVV